VRPQGATGAGIATVQRNLGLAQAGQDVCQEAVDLGHGPQCGRARPPSKSPNPNAVTFLDYPHRYGVGLAGRVTSRDRSAEPRSSSASKRSTEAAPSRIWQRDRVLAPGIASPLAGIYGTSGPLGQLRCSRSPITASEITERQPHRTSCQAATSHCPAAFPPISSPWPPSSTPSPTALSFRQRQRKQRHRTTDLARGPR
jgi:hypothetical protein